MLGQKKGSEFFMVMTVLVAVIVGIFIIFFSQNSDFTGKASETVIEKCNNVDDNQNGLLDEGCDSDKDNYWDRKMACNGFYRNSNGLIYSCGPEMMDLDDDNPNISNI